MLVVDDHAILRSLVAELLRNKGFEVAEAETALRARELLTSFDPDLVILDVNFGDGPSGVHLGHIISELHPGTAIMYLTAYPASLASDVQARSHVKNSVVVSKNDVVDPGELLAAVEAALRGDASGTISVDALSEVDKDFARLTATQREILRLVALGWTNAAIAELRNTQERSVEKQIRIIYDVLGLEARNVHNARVLAAKRYIDVMGPPVQEPSAAG